MRPVILESPFAGKSKNPVIAAWQRWRNRQYARACLRHALLKGDAPIASHLLYTQRGVLNDGDAVERCHGIRAGLAWYGYAKAAVVYVDRGISGGMQQGMDAAKANAVPIEYRTLDPAIAALWGSDTWDNKRNAEAIFIGTGTYGSPR